MRPSPRSGQCFPTFLMGLLAVGCGAGSPQPPARADKAQAVAPTVTAKKQIAKPNPWTSVPETETKREYLCLALSPDQDQLFVSLRHAFRQVLWNLKTGHLVWQRQASRTLHAAFSPNGKWLAVDEDGYSGPSTVFLLDRATGKTIRTFEGAEDFARVQFNGDTEITATTGYENARRLTWPIKGGPATSRHEDNASYPEPFPIKSNGVEVTRSADKKSLVITGPDSTQNEVLLTSGRAFQRAAFLGEAVVIAADTDRIYFIARGSRKLLLSLVPVIATDERESGKADVGWLAVSPEGFFDVVKNSKQGVPAKVTGLKLDRDRTWRALKSALASKH